MSLKKISVFLLVFIFALSSFIVSDDVHAAKGDITINIYGDRVDSDVAPFIVNGRTLVPIRVISEYLHCVVGWDNATRTVTVLNGAKTIKLKIGSATAYVNGKPIKMDVKPLIKNGRTMVPIRFISELFGLKVGWYGDIRMVTLDLEKSDKTKYALIVDNDLSKVKGYTIPANPKKGDLFYIREIKGGLAYGDVFTPVGDLPESWAFAKGHIPLRNLYVNPDEKTLEKYCNVCWLNKGEITFTSNSVDKRVFKQDGGYLTGVVKREKDRVLVTMFGGEYDSFVSKKDISFKLKDFKFDGYPDGKNF